MAQNFNSGSILQPLNVGNVVSAGLVIYRSRLKAYLGVTLTASLWMLLAVAGLIPVALPIIQAIFSRDPTPLFWLLLLIPLWFLLVIFCSAKFLLNSALISRLAYGDLINQPETVNVAREQIKRRMWWFFLTQFLVNLILSTTNILLQFLQAIVVLVSAATRNNSLVGVLTLVLFLAFLVGYFWLYSRFFIPEVPLAVEESPDGVKAIARSWTLTQGSAFRIQLIIFVTLLVTTPLYGLLLIPLIFAAAAIIPRLVVPNSESILILVGLIFLGIILSLAVNLLILPFWQVIKAVIYYDLRGRREGLGLKLRDSLNPPPEDTNPL